MKKKIFNYEKIEEFIIFVGYLKIMKKIDIYWKKGIKYDFREFKKKDEKETDPHKRQFYFEVRLVHKTLKEPVFLFSKNQLHKLLKIIDW